MRFEPDTLVQPHAHLHDEIIYVVAGSLVLGSRVLEPGSSVFIVGKHALQLSRRLRGACTS